MAQCSKSEAIYPNGTMTGETGQVARVRAEDPDQAPDGRFLCLTKKPRRYATQPGHLKELPGTSEGEAAG